MKLIYRIALRLSLVLLPLLALWAVLFYAAMVDEINDEADDALEDYSELIVTRMLAGRALPSLNSGSNNSYSIAPVDEAYASEHPRIVYYDAEVFIPEKDETEPARILTTVFQDRDGNYFELKVATPTFEKDDLLETILGWVVSLYFLLLVTIVGVTVWVLHRSMRPLYALLRWLDSYVPGRNNPPVPDDTNISEFRRLNEAAQRAADRSDELFDRQKQFIGNASHELQTPLAVLGNRLEWLLDRTELTEEQMGELFQMQRTLGGIVRLNRTLLLLTKIDNGQFPETEAVDMNALVRRTAEDMEEIYAYRNMRFTLADEGPLTVRMNPSLAGSVVANLVKNAFVHGDAGGEIVVTVAPRRLTVANSGAGGPLDAGHIFDRFYQGAKKEGSTGLGLAVVDAVCRLYGLKIAYSHADGRHCFTVDFPA